MASARRILLGWGLGVVVGIPTGLLMGRIVFVPRLLDPYIEFFRAMGNPFLTIVAAEIVAAQEGVGALIWTSRNYGRTEWIFVGIFTLGVMGFVFDRVIRVAAKRLLGRYAVKV